MKQQGEIWIPESWEEGEKLIQRLFPQHEETIYHSHGSPMGDYWETLSSERQRFFNESFRDHIYARRDLQLRRCSCPREEHDEVEKYILRIRQPKPQEGWKSKFPEYSSREREEKFKEIDKKLEGDKRSMAKAMLLLWSIDPVYEELPLFSKGRHSEYEGDELPSNRRPYGELHKSTNYWFSTKDTQKGWEFLQDRFGKLSS